MVLTKRRLYGVMQGLVSLIFIFALFTQNAYAAMRGPVTLNTYNTTKRLSIALIGDSYTAGNGAGDYYGDANAYNSHRNWGNIYANWIKDQGVKTILHDYSHSGYTTKEVREKQLKNIASDTDLVMMTVGGNDAKFSNIVKQCFAWTQRDPAGCRRAVNYANNQMPHIMDQTKKILENLQSKLSTHAEVVLVGYPLLSTDSDYSLHKCYSSVFGMCTDVDVYDAAQRVRELGKSAAASQAKLVHDWNKHNGLEVKYVSNIIGTFAGHEPDPSVWHRNPYRWIDEFRETETRVMPDGKTKGKSAPLVTGHDANFYYHPGITGHQKMAQAIIDQIGVPSAVEIDNSKSEMVDVAFVIDTTKYSALDDSIFDTTPRQQLAQAVGDIGTLYDSARFSVVEYKDFPNYGGEPGDFPARVDQNFTFDTSKIEHTINTMSTGGGGDFKNTEYSGLMKAFDLDWRPGVTKMVYLLGWSPKDPEPVTGYNGLSVFAKAFFLDPVQVFPIDISAGGSLYGVGVQQLANKTGGRIIHTLPNHISDSMLTAIGDTTNEPFGWIQGPYSTSVGQAVTLDARASYARQGDIDSIAWDLNGDGHFETHSTSLLLTYTFTHEYDGMIGVQITDSNGNKGVGTTQLNVLTADTATGDNYTCPDGTAQVQTDSPSDACDGHITWPGQPIPGVYATIDGKIDTKDGKLPFAPAPAEKQPTMTPGSALTSDYSPKFQTSNNVTAIASQGHVAGDSIIAKNAKTTINHSNTTATLSQTKVVGHGHAMAIVETLGALAIIALATLLVLRKN